MRFSLVAVVFCLVSLGLTEAIKIPAKDIIDPDAIDDVINDVDTL